MGKTVGIDLGTTNSVISTLEGGEPIVIANSEGFRTTPSIVAFTKTGDTLVGETAKRQAVTNVDRTISSVKRHMGESWTTTIDNKKYTPQEISARILTKLKNDAETYLGEPVTDAVITVPAYFNDSQRQATKEAGEIAGLKVLRIINEPTAAALAYGLDKGKEDELILVFDLGGGTFDVSLLEVGKDAEDGFTTIQVKATSGDNNLGGDDWDKVITDWIVSDFKKENSVDLSTDKIAMQRIKEAAEQAKKELSSSTSTTIQLPYLTLTAEGPLNLEKTLTRAQFENLTQNLLERTRKPFEQVIADAKIKVEDINHVVLVGGSTRMPAVAELVQKITGKPANKGVNPDEVVAIGSAVQASVLKGDRKDVLLIDVTPLSLGLETAGGVMTKLIERNTAIPSKRTEVFSTAADNQAAVTIQIFQGEREFTRDNKKLGTFDLKVAPAPRGVPQIEVSFDIDANGLVQVSAKDKGTGQEQSISITGGTNLSKADIERMVADAAANAVQDAERKEVVELKNAAEQLTYTATKALNEHENSITADLKAEIVADIDSVESALKEENLSKASLAAPVEKLQKSVSKIGEQVYANNQPEQPAATTEEKPSPDEDVIDAEIVDDEK